MTFAHKPPKPKKCCICQAQFIPTSRTQKVCGFHCAVEYTRKLSEKKERKQIKERKDALKTRREWLDDAQGVFNAYIRERDRDLPCISCGKHSTGTYHAGHYRTVAAAPQLRYDEANVHKQCGFNCNVSKSGNIVEYRINLIKKIGIEEVERLETDSSVRRWTIDDAKQIKAHYKQKLNELRKQND